MLFNPKNRKESSGGLQRLAIITDCLHVRTEDGRAGTANHIFLRQMEALAAPFKSVIICCPFVPGSPDTEPSLYTNPRIRFLPVPNAGGDGAAGKWSVIKTIPAWLRAFRTIQGSADVVYQRFPNNINIPGFFYFYFTKKKVFATYTGNWFAYRGEPFTYRLQRWLLKKYFRGPAGIYFDEPQARNRIFKTFSPSYTLPEWQAETKLAEQKIAKAKAGAMALPVFIAVGKLAPLKNQQYILDNFKKLHEQGLRFLLYIAGDGPLYRQYVDFVEKNGLQHCIFITGRQNYAALKDLYRRADFLIHASLVEGYVKVPVEGFFYGVVPIINRIAIAGEMIGNNERGYIFSAQNKWELAELVASLLQTDVSSTIARGRQYAKEKTMEAWASQWHKMLKEYYEITHKQVAT